MNYRAIGCPLHSTGSRQVAIICFCECGNEILDSIKDGDFLAQLSNMNFSRKTLHHGVGYYLLTYLHIPWCRVLFEKLIVIQLAKKYPAFL